MATTASDIVSEQAVRSVLEEQLTKTYQFRRAFRNHDATDINDNSFSFPDRTVELDRDDVLVVGEQADYPRSGTEYGQDTVVYDKRGFEVVITDEAVADSRVDVEMDTQSQELNAWQGSQDYLAFQVLNNNLNAAGPIGDDTGALQYSEVVEARSTLWDDKYDVGSMMLFVEGGGWSDISSMSEFTPASELGDYVVQNAVLPDGNLGSAFIGSVGGIPTFATNTGDLGDREAFMVDTSAYGYESTRWNQEIIQYRDEEHDQDVWKIRGRNGFVATDPSAAVKITG